MKYCSSILLALVWCLAISTPLLAQKSSTSKSRSGSSLSSNKPLPINPLNSSSSSVKKQPTKSTPLGRAFQDLTSRYNRYFNAKLKYEESTKSLLEKHKEDYNEMLPVYAIKGGDGKVVSFNLDEINKKASINIQKKPNSKWVDDSYLLLGQAFYLMGDYESAVKSFAYINNRFSNNIRMSYDVRSKEQMQKMRQKEQEQQKKDRDYERKLKEQERQDKIEKEQERRDKLKEDQADAKKEREKKAADAKKEREKEAKARAKEREKEIKAREKEREREKKQREKDKKAREKARKQGKSLPPKSTTNADAAAEKAAKEKAEKETEAAKKAAEKEAALDAKRSATEKEAAEKEAAAAEAKAQAAADSAELAAQKSVVLERSGKEKSYRRGGFMRHQLAKYDAQLWLARTYIETDKMTEAAALIKKMNDDKAFPHKKKADLQVLESFYYLQNKQTDKAQIALREAVSHLRPRSERARLYYILGQLAMEDNDPKRAVDDFEKVTRNKPVYEMELNARLLIAQAKLQSGEFSPTQAIAYLTKMAKEDKNVDYADQILFAMAEIESASGNEEKAAEYLAQSAGKSTSNKDQKVKSMLRLADMNYKAQKYISASAYYDSTYLLMPKTDAKYAQVAERKAVLGDLARDLKTIALQDSLQRIANMPERERTEFLQDLIAQLRKDAAAKDTTGMAEVNKTKMSSDSKAGSTSYFYNDSARLNGYKDFALKWGSRPLTDNWRVASKQSGDAVTPTATATAVDTAGYNRDKLMEMAAKGELSVDAIKQKLPITPQQKAMSDSLLTDALYRAATTFKDRLKNNVQADAHYERLMQRYPTNKYAPDALYARYQIATDDRKNSAANTHKDQLVQQYPNHKYAKLLADPNYIATLNSQRTALEKYYNDTYQMYQQDQFAAVKQRSTEVNTLFAENPLQPKFDLLNAFVAGKTENKAAYVASLKGIVSKYPTDEVRQKAQEILSYLDKDATAASTPTSSKNKKYKFEPAAKHYVIVAFDKYTAQINQVTAGLSDFNSGSFSSDALKTNQMLLDPEHQIVLVKEFANADKAKIYYETLQLQKDTAIKATDAGYKIFYISKVNFNQYFKDKDTAAYIEYFNEMYGGGKK